MRLLFSIILFLIISAESFGQSTNDVLNLLIANKAVSQEQGDSLRADAAIRQQEAELGKKNFLVSAARQIQISGYTQLRYQQLDEKGKRDGFDIRRARLDINGNFTPYLSYRLMTDFADKPKIMDAYAEIKFNDYLILTAGQFRVPFSNENLIPVRKFDLIDFSQAIDALVFRSNDVIGNQNGRDIGIQLGGTLLKRGVSSLVEYKVGVFNGSGINIADTANNAKDIAGRLIVNPVKGLSIGASYYSGWDKAIKPAAVYAGKSQPRDRFGFDISYTFAGLALRGEYIHGLDGKINKAGWFVLAEYYILPQKLQMVAKYDTFDSNLTIDKNSTTNYVAGMNFSINSWSRIQAFYTLRTEQGTQVSNNYLSIQYQISF